MGYLWKYLDSQDWYKEAKYKAVFLITGLLSAIIGFIIWLIVRRWILSTWDWMICFIGYPVLFSLLFVYPYACCHDFHDGKA